MMRTNHVAGRWGTVLLAAAILLGPLGCRDTKPAPSSPAASQPASPAAATPPPVAPRAAGAPVAEATAFVPPERSNLPMAQALAEARAKWAALATPEQAKAADAQVAALAPLTAGAVKLAAKAPDFDALATNGKELTLETLLKDGPVVLVWFRGGWCRFCSIQLSAMQQILSEVEKTGAAIVAVSPQTVEYNRKTADHLGLDYELLSDPGNLGARKWGLLYALNDEMMDMLKGRVDLAKCNGDKSGEMPMTAVYVIAADGVVQYAAVDPDFRNRPDPQAVLAVLKDPAKIKPAAANPVGRRRKR
ncbi:MAG: peroxiredoxin-like family protein [Planctomycetaceae bacterium]|nr:AhpC/TSA family protein [Planctomycetaceae bacterium]